MTLCEIKPQKNSNILGFSFGLHYLFALREDRLHLGNTKKNEFSFGISLGLHYLCSRNEDRQCDIKDTDAAGFGRGHPLLDVSR